MEGENNPLTQSRLCEGSCELVATKLKSLKINRVDLVPEGANSAAFVTLYKGKEGKPMEFEEILEKMKPEHAEVIKSKFAEAEAAKEAAEEELAKAKTCPVCGEKHSPFCVEKANDTSAEGEEPEEEDESEDDVEKETTTTTGGTTSFDEDETLLKSLPEELQSFVAKMRQQKEAAEEVAKAAIARERHAEAVSKATELKALPIATDELVSFIEKSNEETVDMLTAIAKAIDSTVLTEAGSNDSGSFAKSAGDAWAKLESKAAEIAKERGISKAKGMTAAIDEFPELYREYLEGGAN